MPKEYTEIDKVLGQLKAIKTKESLVSHSSSDSFKQPAAQISTLTILSNKPFLFLALNLSTVFFLTTNIYFWLSDYLITVDGIKYEKVVFMFTFICITAPTSGAIVSGIVGQKIGGYESQWALPVTIGAGLIITAASLPWCFITSPNVKFLLLWFQFFGGGIVVPINTGVMLRMVEPHQRPKANAIANCMYNVLGFFPAPLIYGMIQNSTGGEKSKWAMVSNLFLTLPAVLYLMAALYCKNKATVVK